jgi:hypothetical protein
MPKDQGTGSSTAGSGAAGSGTTAGGVVGSATNAVRDVVSNASDMAGHAYEQGSRYLRDASDHVPDIGEYAERVRRPLAESPVMTALAVGAIGYLAAYLVHGGGLRSLQETHPEHDARPSKRSRRRHRR